MDLIEIAKVLIPAAAAGIGAYTAVRVELAELRTKVQRAELDIQNLFNLQSHKVSK